MKDPKKPNNKDREHAISEIMAYIEKYGVIDKDASTKKSTYKKAAGQQKRQRNRQYRMVIDLHGMTSENAAMEVRISLERCRQRGIMEVLIIHGRGLHSVDNDGPILKKLVRDMLDHEFSSVVRDYRPAPPKDGGAGATIVYLR